MTERIDELKDISIKNFPSEQRRKILEKLTDSKTHGLMEKYLTFTSSKPQKKRRP